MSANARKERNVGGTDAFLASLVAGHTIANAARAAGISEATAHRRLKQPDVKAKLDELRHATLTTAADRLATLATGAVVVLGNIANDADVAPGIRVRACAELLSKALAVRDVAVLEQRIAHLEHLAKLAEAQRASWSAA